jgi:CoA:oxalate CoA-transferase
MTIAALPLDGLLVLDFSQFLAGPLAGLRLADMGARVIKIERPDGGDLCRRLYLSDTEFDGDSTLFHAINRNKESFAADLKNPADMAAIKALVARADVVIQNFRPGVIERIGLDYPRVQAINPRIVYASISGYGRAGPWSALPGQDLLAQARSGVMWLSGSAGQGPVPLGLSVADMLAGAAATQAILAALVRRGITGKGSYVETSLLEAMIDLQFELITTHLNDGNRLPERAEANGANAYLAAPYGVYRTRDGYLALAMTPLKTLARLLDLHALETYADTPASEFNERNALLRLLAARLAMEATATWLSRLEPEGVWCAEVLEWPAVMQSESFIGLDMLQRVQRESGTQLQTTRLPMSFDGMRPSSDRGAPGLGAHTERIRHEFGL